MAAAASHNSNDDDNVLEGSIHPANWSWYYAPIGRRWQPNRTLTAAQPAFVMPPGPVGPDHFYRLGMIAGLGNCTCPLCEAGPICDPCACEPVDGESSSESEAEQMAAPAAAATPPRIQAAARLLRIAAGIAGERAGFGPPSQQTLEELRAAPPPLQLPPPKPRSLEEFQADLEGGRPVVPTLSMFRIDCVGLSPLPRARPMGRVCLGSCCRASAPAVAALCSHWRARTAFGADLGACNLQRAYLFRAS